MFKYLKLFALAGGGLFLMSACGNSGGGGNNTTIPVTTPQSTCTAYSGYVYTSCGQCVPTGSIPAGCTVVSTQGFGTGYPGGTFTGSGYGYNPTYGSPAGGFGSPWLAAPVGYGSVPSCYAGNYCYYQPSYGWLYYSAGGYPAYGSGYSYPGYGYGYGYGRGYGGGWGSINVGVFL